VKTHLDLPTEDQYPKAARSLLQDPKTGVNNMHQSKELEIVTKQNQRGPLFLFRIECMFLNGGEPFTVTGEGETKVHIPLTRDEPRTDFLSVVPVDLRI
jgi:hypothetical protein